MQLSTCRNFLKHKVRKGRDAASSPSQWPRWDGKQQWGLQLVWVWRVALFPPAQLTLPVAQCHLGRFIDAVTPAGCCPSLLRNPLPQQSGQGRCGPASVPGVLAEITSSASSAFYPVTPNVLVCFCVGVTWWLDQSVDRTRASAEGPSSVFRYQLLHPSREDGGSLCAKLGIAFLAIAKCSFLQDKAQQLPLVARSNPTLCF